MEKMMVEDDETLPGPALRDTLTPHTRGSLENAKAILPGCPHRLSLDLQIKLIYCFLIALGHLVEIW